MVLCVLWTAYFDHGGTMFISTPPKMGSCSNPQHIDSQRFDPPMLVTVFFLSTSKPDPSFLWCHQTSIQPAQLAQNRSSTNRSFLWSGVFKKNLPKHITDKSKTFEAPLRWEIRCPAPQISADVHDVSEDQMARRALWDKMHMSIMAFILQCNA